MSTSSTPPEHSADESGYVTCCPRRNSPVEVEEDPSERNDETSSESPPRSPMTVIPPPRVPPPPPQGVRFRTTARKSVPMPVRVTFGGSTRAEGETSSRPTPRVSPTVVTGVPARMTQGMTMAESRWVQSLAQELHAHRAQLDYHRHVMSSLTEALYAHSYRITRAAEATLAARRTIRRLYTCLAVIASALLVVGSWFWMARP